MTTADRYTHGYAQPVVRSHAARTAQDSAAYLLPHLGAGMSLLDVGCGPGSITIDLARAVAPGRVLGIDIGAHVVDRARRAASAVGSTADFTVGDIYDDALAPESFDVVHAHQVLQHLPDPVGALRRMGGLARPGGIVAARDADYRAMFWHPSLPELDRWREIYRTLARANGGEPDAGRHLPAWAHAAGFAQVAVTSSVWTYADDAARSWWGGMWAERIRASSITDQAISRGLADRRDIDDLAAGWQRWAADPDSYFAIVHTEIVCRV